MEELSFEISTKRDRINLDFVHEYLSVQAYWAKDRSKDDVKTSIANSLCFGAYLNSGKQIGFGRVVTDYVVFAWVMDVFVDDEYKGQGVGKLIMESMINHPQLSNLKRWGLCTYDAHKLYEKYGFTELDKPDIHMEKVL